MTLRRIPQLRPRLSNLARLEFGGSHRNSRLSWELHALPHHGESKNGDICLPGCCAPPRQSSRSGENISEEVRSSAPRNNRSCSSLGTPGTLQQADQPLNHRPTNLPPGRASRIDRILNRRPKRIGALPIDRLRPSLIARRKSCDFRNGVWVFARCFVPFRTIGESRWRAIEYFLFERTTTPTPISSPRQDTK
jgi:hypothetical protein